MNAVVKEFKMVQKTPNDRRIHPATPGVIRDEFISQTSLMKDQWVGDMISNKSLRTNTSAAAVTTPRVVKHLVNKLELGTLKDGDIVAEAGTGPGPFPQAVLREVRADIIYIAIELNPAFTKHLRETIDDSRLVVVNESAEKIGEIIRRYGSQARRVISSMPFSKDVGLTQKILRQVIDALASDGRFLMANYTRKSRQLVKAAFGEKHCDTDFFFNSPPIPPVILTILAGKPNGNRNGNRNGNGNGNGAHH